MALTPEQIAECYIAARERWLDGCCPCCGARDVAGDEGAVAIAEGVLLCGYCCSDHRQHHRDREHVESLLTALLPQPGGAPWH